MLSFYLRFEEDDTKNLISNQLAFSSGLYLICSITSFLSIGPIPLLELTFLIVLQLKIKIGRVKRAFDEITIVISALRHCNPMSLSPICLIFFSIFPFFSRRCFSLSVFHQHSLCRYLISFVSSFYKRRRVSGHDASG